MIRQGEEDTKKEEFREKIWKLKAATKAVESAKREEKKQLDGTATNSKKPWGKKAGLLLAVLSRKKAEREKAKAQENVAKEAAAQEIRKVGLQPLLPLVTPSSEKNGGSAVTKTPAPAWDFQALSSFHREDKAINTRVGNGNSIGSGF